MSDEKKYDTKCHDDCEPYSSLMSNLRILGNLNRSDFLGTGINENNFYCIWSNSWWNTLDKDQKIKTFKSTYNILQDIYNIELPDYIYHAKSIEDKNNYLLNDIKNINRKALSGLRKLKDTYNIAFQTKNGGMYDNLFDELIKTGMDLFKN